MRFRKYIKGENIDKKYILIVDAINFCDVYIGKYSRFSHSLNECLCTPLEEQMLGGTVHGVGIKLTQGVCFPERFFEEHKDNVFVLTKEQYDFLFKIKSANILRLVKRYCY